MGDYLVLLTGGPDGRQATVLRAALRAAGWRESSTSNLEIWTGGSSPPGVVARAGGALLGEGFFSAQAAASSEEREDSLAWARRLATSAWGGFVAVRGAAANRPAAIYRDPSGAVDAHLVRVRGVELVASSLAAPGLRALLGTVRPDREAVARWLVDPCEAGAIGGLPGVEPVFPGFLTLAGTPATTHVVWNAVEWAERTEADTDEAASAQRLQDGVREAACAFLTLARPLVLEISGGLDSAVAAGAFAASRPQRAVHFHSPDPEADERHYAYAVADRWALELDEVRLDDDGLHLDELTQYATAARPSFNAVDRPYDAAAAAAARARGAWGWVTGQGGDAVFLNLRAPELACAVVARRGWRAVFDPEVRELAERLRSSVWRVARAARRARGRPEAWRSWAPLAGAARDLADLRSGGSRHPWLRGGDGLEPAKRLQLVGLAYALLNTGDSRRSRAARLIHLPLQQPVLEAVLPIPPERLAPAGRDRPLARAAFADILPEAVRRRAGKGDLTAAYGRRLTRTLGALRPWLLDGELRKLGLLDTAVLEPLLSADGLFTDVRSGDLLKLAAIEGWLRAWS